MKITLKPTPYILVIILFFAFVTRMWNLHSPEKYVFDEVYHAVTAKLISHNDPKAYEWWNPPPEPNTAVDWLHPPLAKYTQAASMVLFGENEFGWRFSSVIFGVLVIWLTYLLTKNLFASDRTALLAAFLASLDGLLLVQSRVAMNDIHVTFFILLTLLMYVKYRQDHPTSWRWLLASGIAGGLAVGTKWSGIFALGTIGFFETLRFAVTLIQRQWPKTHSSFLKYCVSFVSSRLVILILIPCLLYLAAYTHMFWQGKSLICTQKEVIPNTCYLKLTTDQAGQVHEKYISHFEELHHQIWWYQTNLKATHGYQSRPWQWWLNLRPVWYSVDYSDPAHIANIYAFGNPILFWAGDIAVVFLLAISLISWVQIVRKWLKTGKLKVGLFPTTGFLLFSYFIVWLPWILSPRIMFFYHYTPAVPLLAIILAYLLMQVWGEHDRKLRIKQLRANQWLVIMIVALVVIAFGLWYPNWTEISVPKTFADTLYFSIPSWK